MPLGSAGALPCTLATPKFDDGVAGVTPSWVMFVPSTVSTNTTPLGSGLPELKVTEPCTYVPRDLA